MREGGHPRWLPRERRETCARGGARDGRYSGQAELWTTSTKIARLEAGPEAFEDIRLDVAEGGLGYHDPDGRVRGTLTPYQESGPGILTVPTSSGAGSSTHTGMLAPLIVRG